MGLTFVLLKIVLDDSACLFEAIVMLQNDSRTASLMTKTPNIKSG